MHITTDPLKLVLEIYPKYRLIKSHLDVRMFIAILFIIAKKQTTKYYLLGKKTLLTIRD